MDVVSLLKKALAMDASDIHLTVGTSPVLRINGVLVKLEAGEEMGYPLTQSDTMQAVRALMTDEQFETWKQKGELDFSYSLPGVGRFRVSSYRQRGCATLAIRLMPYIVPSLESLGLPPAVAGMADKKQGLVLVTGPAGSGKSTTLAALIDKINRERACHIITIEDPIEYLHQHKKSIVEQREIGSDTHSMTAALQASLRQDPDVIVVGDMRALETISTSITAADTGHLVFATMHTNSAAKTVEHIIEVFPAGQQEQIKVQLAATLQGVITQQLLPCRAGSGRVLAAEVLIATPAVRSLIREGKTHQLSNAMQTGGRWGMATMDMSLKELVRTGQVSLETALQYCADRESFTRGLSS
ncbi:MAG: type IV pilus twitching motility protein PilT [Peptococcaceae bacterium]|nr:type IV pilus twitching motility protein PilT [Peptococcaceae bacterium]MDH7525365.1 type IV pilus twitching motility protein PilT [Peptococcaceae bacterium]